MLYCVFELGLNDLLIYFFYSTDDEQNEDVKNKVWNNLQSFAFELGQILKNVLRSVNLTLLLCSYYILLYHCTSE